MIWIIAFFIIILVSSVLAYRSMKDYEEFPDAASLNSLFYIGAPQNLTAEVLKKLHDLNFNNKKFFSLEKLVKGKEKAWVIYGSRDLISGLPELNLVELEDYLSGTGELAVSDKKVSVNQVLSWLVSPKNNPQKALHVTDQINELVVEDKQKIFLQLVLMPTNKSSAESFQATFRVMVVDNDPIGRVELAKRTERAVNAATGLNKYEDGFPESKKFDSFKQRSLIPKEVAEFNLTTDEILALVKA